MNVKYVPGRLRFTDRPLSHDNPDRHVLHRSIALILQDGRRKIKMSKRPQKRNNRQEVERKN